MFCKQCGAKVPDGTLFCVGCGSPMNAKPVSSSARALQGGAQEDAPVHQPPKPAVQPPLPVQAQPPQPGVSYQPTQAQPPKPGVAYQPVQVQPPQPGVSYQPTQAQPPKPGVAYQPIQVQPPQPGVAYQPVKVQPAPITVTDPTAPAPRAVAPAPAKSGGGKGVLIAVIVVLVVALVGVVVFGFLQGWFGSTAQEDEDDEPTKHSSRETSHKDDPGGTEPTDQPIGEPGMVEHQWEGLTFSLPEDLEQYHWDVDYMNYYGDELRVLVASYVLSDYSDDIYTSRDFADHCASVLEDQYEDMVMDSVGDIYYYEGYYPAYDRYEVNGFYVSGDYGYIFMVYSDPDAGLEEEMIQLATSAVVDDRVIPAVQPGGGQTVSTMRPSYEGLTLELDVLLEANGYYVGGAGYRSDDLDLEIYAAPLDDYGNSVKDAASLAELYRKDLDGVWDEIGVGTRNRVKYVLCQDQDGFTCVIGCYVQDDGCWEVWVYSYTSMVSEDDLVRIATSGQIGS